jgi:hypothetical protein
MNRLEIIHLRLAGAAPRGLAEDIRRAIAADGKGSTARLYRHATLDGDLSIHLHFGSDEGSRHSDLVTHLARALREYGMVEHTVWLEAGE